MEEMQVNESRFEDLKVKDIDHVLENTLDKSDITMEDNNKAHR